MTSRKKLLVGLGLLAGVLATTAFWPWDDRPRSNDEMDGSESQEGVSQMGELKFEGPRADEQGPRVSATPAGVRTFQRRAQADLVVLPVEGGGKPHGNGLEAWLEYYSSVQGAGGAPAGGMHWWTEDPSVVATFMEEWGASLQMIEDLYSERWAKEAEDPANDSGRRFLEKSVEFCESKLGALEFELDWLSSQGLGAQEARGLAEILRAHAIVLSTSRNRPFESHSMFAPFFVPIETHVSEILGVRIQDLPSAKQSQLLQSYSQSLLEIAGHRARYKTIEYAIMDRAGGLGLPFPGAEKLSPELVAMQELEGHVNQVWQEFLSDLEGE